MTTERGVRRRLTQEFLDRLGAELAADLRDRSTAVMRWFLARAKDDRADAVGRLLPEIDGYLTTDDRLELYRILAQAEEEASSPPSPPTPAPKPQGAADAAGNGKTAAKGKGGKKKPPTDKMVAAVVNICRKQNLEPPEGYELDGDVCRKFLDKHMPKKEGA